MKRLLPLTLCLLTTGSAFNVLADPCDNLRNNQQAYRDCVNDWYGRSNRGSAPTPWWKNYDPNAGSGSAAAEAPTLSKQQQLELQRQQEEAARQAAEAQRRQDQAESDFNFARGRLDWLNQHGLNSLKPNDVLPAFIGAHRILEKYGEGAFGTERACQIYENTGHALVRLGRMEEAEGWFKRSVEINDDTVRRNQTVSEYDIGNYNRSLNALADFYEAQGRLKEAFDLHDRRFGVTRRSVFDHHPETISAATAYLRVMEKLNAARKHTETFKLLNAMNEALQREDYEKALKASENLLIWAKKENKDSLAAIAQRNKAKALIKLNRGGEAHDLLKALLATLDKTPPPLNRNEGFGDKQSALHGVLGDLAEENESSGGYGYAEPYRRRMLEIQEKTRGPEHLETLTALRDLANNLSRFGKYIAAVPVRQRAVAVAEKLPDAQSQLPELRKALLSDYRLAGGFDEQANALEAQIDWKAAWSRLAQEANKSLKARQYEEAIKQGQNVLEFAQKHGDSKEWRVATSQNNLGVYYRAAKQYEQAEVYYKKALESYATANGADSPSLITPLLELSALYDLKKRYAEADVLYRRVLPLQEKKHGQEHLAVAKTLHKLAYFHVRNDRYSEAEPLYTRALAIIDKQPNNDDDVALSILSGLADVYRYTQRDDEAKRLDERYQKWLARK